MFGTFITDAYTKDEILEIADSLEETCSPNDVVGWASSGIYSFWNYYTKEVYYIGLAIDLGDRFKQHNGILPISDNACKYQQISDYFAINEKLGYTIFVQSPLSQAETHRNKFNLSFNDDTIWISEESKENIKIVEGSFIEAFRKRIGNLPQWNKVGGYDIGAKRATSKMYDQLAFCLTGTQNSPLVARSSLREIAKNPVFEWYEINLHGVRMLMLNKHLSFEESIAEQLAFNPFFSQVYNEIVASNYLEKNPII